MDAFDDTDGRLPAPKDIVGWAVERQYQEKAGSIPRQASIPPFWQFKPPSGLDLFTEFRGTVAAGAGSSSVLPLSAGLRPWTILSAYNGVMSSFALFVDTPLATLDITFVVLANGAPIPGWDQLRPFPVGANAIIQPINGTLQLPENTTLTVLVKNNAASGPWTVGAQVAGWMWPRIDEQQTFGA